MDANEYDGVVDCCCHGELSSAYELSPCIWV